MREGNSPHLLQQVRKGRRETLQRQQPSATDPNRMMDAAPESSGSASSNQRNIAGPSAAQHPSCPTSLPGEDRSKEDSETKDLQRAARSCTSEQHSRSNSSSPRASHEANNSNLAPDLTNMAGKWEDKKAAQAKKPDDQRAKQIATETIEMCRRWVQRRMQIWRRLRLQTCLGCHTAKRARKRKMEQSTRRIQRSSLERVA